MKVAEALVERKAAQQRLNELNERLQRVALIQEGETPRKAPAELLAELDATATRLQALMVAINRTNIQATLPGGESVMAAIARRDVLKMRMNILDGLLRLTGQTTYRARNTEIRIVCTLPVVELQHQRDALAKQYRELDAAIQGVNWTIELLE